MTGYINIRQILDDVLAHPMLRDLSLERAVDHAVHFIRIVGMPKMFEDKIEKISVENYRAQLPNDFYTIISIRKHGSNQVFQHNINSHDVNRSSGLTYRIQGNIIYTSLSEGDIDVEYKSLVVDDEGYPMIPDNSSFIKALELYIKKQYFTVLFDMGKINQQILNNTQQEYAWYVGQCQSDLVRPTLDEMHSITNMWNSLIIRGNNNPSNKTVIEHYIKLDSEPKYMD